MRQRICLLTVLWHWKNDNSAAKSTPLVSQQRLKNMTIPLILKTRKHSSRMRTDRTITRLSRERVAMRAIMDRQNTCENITFPLRSVMMSKSGKTELNLCGGWAS